jgi:uncharacterized protein (TIGR03643 family)
MHAVACDTLDLNSLALVDTHSQALTADADGVAMDPLPSPVARIKLPVLPIQSADFTEADKSRICEMAWEDRTPFEAIRMQFGLTEAQTIDLMRSYMKRSSFVMWRKRMTGLKVKHAGLRSDAVQRHRANNRSPSR